MVEIMSYGTVVALAASRHRIIIIISNILTWLTIYLSQFHVSKMIFTFANMSARNWRYQIHS